MRKNIWAIGLLAVLSASACASKDKEAKSFNQKIRTLLAESQTEKSKAAPIEDEIRRIIETGRKRSPLVEGDFSLNKKEEFDKLLQAFERYRGMYQAGKKMQSLMAYTNVPVEAWDSRGLWGAYGQDPILAFNTFRSLIMTAEKLKLSPADRRKITLLYEAWIGWDAQAPSGTLMELMIELAVTNLLIEHHLMSVDDALYVGLLALGREASRFKMSLIEKNLQKRVQPNQAVEADFKVFKQNLREEIREVIVLKESLLPLVRRILAVRS